jgi:hypothetical protein
VIGDRLPADGLSRILKKGVSGREPALRGFCKWAAHPAEGGTALSKTPRAWADGLILVFQHPARGPATGSTP